MRRNTPSTLHISQLQGSAELEEGVAPEHGCQERRIGFEDPVDLGEDGGEIVDPVEGEGGEDGVEGVFGIGEVFFVLEGVAREVQQGVEGEGGVTVEGGGGGVGRCEVGEAGGEWGGDGGGRVGVWVWGCEGAGDVAGIGTEVEDGGEVPLYILCSFD